MSDANAETTRGRRALPITLVVIATILLLIGTFAVWAKRQLLETDTWVDTSTELLEDPAIQDALATFLVAELFDNVDVEAELAAKLPPQAQPLARPIAGGLRQLADEVAKKALAQPQVHDLWEEANRAAHSQFLAIIDDETTAVSTGGGTVTLELQDDPKLDRRPARDQRRRGGKAAARRGIAGDHAVGRARGRTDSGERASHDCLGARRADAAPLRARDLSRRQPAPRDPARHRFSFFIVGALITVLHRVAGDAIVSSLSEVASSDDAVEATWTIGTSQLTDIASSLILYGIVIVLAAWLAGPTSLATSIRSAIAPGSASPSTHMARWSCS